MKTDQGKQGSIQYIHLSRSVKILKLNKTTINTKPIMEVFNQVLFYLLKDKHLKDRNKLSGLDRVTTPVGMLHPDGEVKTYIIIYSYCLMESYTSKLIKAVLCAISIEKVGL